eukprot:415293_1
MGNKSSHSAVKSHDSTLWKPMPSIKHFNLKHHHHSDLYLIAVDDNTIVLSIWDQSNQSHTCIHAFNIVQNEWESTTYSVTNEIERNSNMRIKTIDEEHTFLLKHNTATVLYDFTAQDDDTLTIREAQSLQIIDNSEDLNGWALAVDELGNEGYVPADYVLIDNELKGYEFNGVVNVIFVQNNSDSICQSLDCPISGRFIGISINYSWLLTFGYLRHMNVLSTIPHDIAQLVADSFLMERIHLIECETGHHWRATLDGILQHINDRTK